MADTVLGGGVILVLAYILVLLAAAVLAVVCSLKLRCPICGGPVDRQALRHDHFFCPNAVQISP